MLCGTKSLSVPLNVGQKLTVESKSSGNITWKSFSPKGCWFEVEMSEDLTILHSTDEKVAEMLQKLFREIKSLNPNLNILGDFKITADFNLEWGFGSSSTLISCLSQWSETDGQELLKRSFGGSGYDVACGIAKNPIVYVVNESVENVKLNPNVTDKILFVYLGAKQNSRKEIGRFDKDNVSDSAIQTMNKIVDDSVKCDSIECFEKLMDSSEDLLSELMNRPKIKDAFFGDYPFSIKSMGAWGGDFFLATYRDEATAKKYFSELGYETMFQYNEIVRK